MRGAADFVREPRRWDFAFSNVFGRVRAMVCVSAAELLSDNRLAGFHFNFVQRVAKIEQKVFDVFDSN
jgi:hypothetical protein